MKRLIQIAFSKPLYRWVLVLTLVFGLGLTVASQLELLSLGIAANRGPDFFELFSPKGQKKATTVTYDQLLETWKEIDETKKGEVSSEDVSAYLEKTEKGGIVSKGTALIQRWIPVHKHIWALVLLIALASLFKAITLFAYRFGAKLFSIYVCRDLRQSYFEHIQRLPMSFYHEHNIGALSSRTVNDAYIIADAIQSTLANYIQTPFAVISTLALCFAISWQLSCIVFFGLPFLVCPIIFIAKKIKKFSKQIQKKQEAFSSVLVEFLSGIQTIKLYAMENFSLKKYKEHNDAMAHLEIRSARYDVGSRPILHTIGMLFLITALLFGLWGLKLQLPEVLLFCGLLVVVYEPIKKFAEENGRIQRGVAACERLYEVLDLNPSIQDEKDAKTEVPFEKELAFNAVSFGYGKERIVLSDVSFKVTKGEMIAIVGPTGGGKSTIVSLFTRLFEVDQGSITIDGVPIQQFTQRALRDFFAVVPQRPFIFHDTVRENICYGRTFSDEAVYKAARKAHAEDFIQDLPERYETFLAEGGKSLSGGQQQRLAIARALIKQSPILVLDEATSALDPSSELQIKMALKELKGMVTQIVIAHRLSTIEDADRIIVIDEGRKVGDGTKKELLASCPTFQKIWKPR